MSNKIYRVRQSLFMKILLSLLIALFAVIMFMEFYNIYILGLYRSQAETTYKNSLQLYSDYWSSRLEGINKLLVTSTMGESNDTFVDLCTVTDKLPFEINKVLMLHKLVEISQMYNNQIYAFCYIPNRNVFISSAKNHTRFSDMYELDRQIKKYAETYLDAGEMWNIVVSNEKHYFIKLAYENEGYLGAILPCDTVLQNLSLDADIIAAVALLKGGEVQYQIENSAPYDLARSFLQNLSMTDYQIGITVLRADDDSLLYVLSIIGILLMGVIFGFSNMKVQQRVVLKPLNKLKEAMIVLSGGDLNIRLDDKSITTEEIAVLYHTFNLMAEQITNLKINAYELEIEKQEIKSSFLKLQVQPHFYANILNLIFRLAEGRDVDSIMRIAKVTSRYFRFLLSNKKSVIQLTRELSCVQDYYEIQSIRYPDMLSFDIFLQTDIEGILVPPLILQTFIENSIKHNVTFAPVLKIAVTIARFDNTLAIEISDNGLGFKQDVLARIMRNEDISVDGEHIGITNLKQRLRLIYGESAVLSITQCPDETKIRVELPITEGDGEGESVVGG